MTSLFNLSSVVSLLSNTTITVTRHADDTYDAYGRAVPRTLTTISTGRASLQPIKGSDLNKLPEGENSSTWATLYYSKPLLAGDRVTCDQGSFEVRSLNAWDSLGTFNKTFVRKFDPQEPRA